MDFSFSAYGVKDFRFRNGSGIDPDPSYTNLTLFPSSLAGGIPFISDSVNRFGYIIYSNAYSTVRSSARFEGYGDFLPSRQYENSLNDEIFDGYVTDRRARENAIKRSEKRQEMLSKEFNNKASLNDLAALIRKNLDDGVWDAYEVESIIPKKKESEKKPDEIITDADIDI